MKGFRADLGWAPLLVPICGLYLPALVWVLVEIPGAGEDVALPGLDTLRAAGSSLVLAGGGALVAGAVGFWGGLLLGGYRVRGRRLLSALLLLPFLVPASVVTTAWLGMGFWTQGIPAAALVSGAHFFPVVLWGVARSVSAIPRGETRAARLHLSSGRYIVSFLARRTLGTGVRLTLLVFLLLWPRMEIAGYMGVETVGTRVLAAFTVRSADLEGWILAATSVVFAGAVLLAALPGLARWVSRPTQPEEDEEHERHPGAEAFLWALALLPLATGLGLLASAAGEAPVWEEIRYWGAGFLAEALRCALLAVAVVVLAWRLALRGGVTSQALFVLPLFLPGSLPALAILVGLQPRLPEAVLAGPWLLSLAQATRWGGVALVFGWLAVGSVPAAERRAAELLPGRRARWRVLFPRSLPTLASGALILFALFWGEVESAVLLVPPGYVSPAVGLEQFLHFRFDAQAAQLSLALAFGGGVAAYALGRRGALHG